MLLTSRLLIISLLITVVIASIGSGWLMEKLFLGLDGFGPSTQEFTAPQLETLGKQFSAALSRTEHKLEFVRAWGGQNSQITIEIMDKDDLKLPLPLQNQLKLVEHIVVAAASQLSYFSSLNDTEYFVLRSPIGEMNMQNRTVPILFTFLFYLFLMAAVLLWLYPLVRRLNILKFSAQKLGRGDLQARINPSFISHIGDIEHEFNRMAQRIEDLVEDIKLLSSAVSHELRSPLAKLSLGLDVLSEQDDVDTRRIYEQRLRKTLSEMTELVEKTLKYSRLDSNSISLQFERIDLLVVFKQFVAQHDMDVADVNLLAEDSTYFISADHFYLKMLIDNLFSNAVKYGGGQILIELKRCSEWVGFTIEDNGPGGLVVFSKSLFKPFFKMDDSRSKPSGYGLGLAICKRIIDWHHAEIEIQESEKLSGAKFVVRFNAV